jgi:hypothetical protein
VTIWLVLAAAAALTLHGLHTWNASRVIDGIRWFSLDDFHALFTSLEMTAVGGFVGLVIGYAVKYVADERITLSPGS